MKAVKLKTLYQQAKEQINEKPYDFELAHLKLALSIMLADISLIHESWNDYFNAGPKENLAKEIKDAESLLSTLPSKGKVAKLDKKHFSILIELLAKSRFYHYLTLLPSIDDCCDEYLRGYFIYADWLVLLEKKVDEHYRLVANKEIDHMKLYGLFKELNKDLAENLNWSYEGEFTDDVQKSFKEYLEKQFGVHYVLGNTGGYISLHFGHSMIDQEKTMEQYGQSVNFRYTSLSFLPSNGFHTWFWDGYAASGGWATDKQVIRVKDEYVPDTKSWELMFDEIESERFIQSIKEAEETDKKSASDEAIQYMASVSKKLKLKGLNRLMLETGMTRADKSRQLEFVNYITQKKLENDIYVHESRHAIDHSIGIIPGKKYPAEVLEYRAKLSELALGPIQELSLSSIMASNMNDGTGHGNANQQVIESVIKWMKLNREKLQSLDHDRPLVLQLDKLTAEQIQEAARMADPLYLNMIENQNVAKE